MERNIFAQLNRWTAESLAKLSPEKSAKPGSLLNSSTFSFRSLLKGK
jgi:hypothetical protein